MIDINELLQGPDTNALKLIAILSLSNEVEDMREFGPVPTRKALDALQSAIQSARSDIEALAEGMIFLGGDE
ncbi:MAG TPA: hypothetical protein VIO94_16065 [Phenylobacterium sp.]